MNTSNNSPELSSQNINTDWKRYFFLFLGLVFLVYARSLNGPFHFDDAHSIESNAAIRSLFSIPSLWTDASTSSLIAENRVYRPLTYTFYAICWALGGGATWAFHLLKILLHSSACLMVFLIWRRLFQEKNWLPSQLGPLALSPHKAALILATAFSIHPSATEMVSYISANTSLQCATFYLLAYWGYLRFRDSTSKTALILSVAAFFASTLSKEEGITLPAVLVLTEIFFTNGSVLARVRHGLKKTIPYWAAFILLFVLIHKMTPSSVAQSRNSVQPMEYFITQWRAYLWYMRLWFWPWDLNADNLVFDFSRSFRDWRVTQALIGNLALLSFCFLARRRFPALLFGLLWFYITISPASSVIPLSEAVNEHRMYLAYVGFAGGTFVFLYWLLVETLQPALTPRAFSLFCRALACALLIGTELRISVWNDGEALWQDTIDKNPQSGRAMNNLALIYMQRADYPKALALLDQCEKVWSTYAFCPLNKGIIYLTQKNAVEAEKNLNRAAALAPDSPWLIFRLAQFREELKQDPAGAIVLYMRADALAGHRYVDAKLRLADLQIKIGRQDQAQITLNALELINPNHPMLRELTSKIQKMHP